MGGADHNLFSVEMLFWVQMERQGYDIVQVSHKFTSRHYSSIACSLEAHYVLPAMLKGISSCIYLVYMHVVLSSKGQCIFFLLFFFSFFFNFMGKNVLELSTIRLILGAPPSRNPVIVDVRFPRGLVLASKRGCCFSRIDRYPRNMFEWMKSTSHGSLFTHDSLSCNSKAVQKLQYCCLVISQVW